MNKSIIALLIAVALAIGVGVYYKYSNSDDTLKYISSNDVKDGQSDGKTIIKIGDAVIKVDIAKTPKERQKGLSGRNKLNDGEGMLFVYDISGIYTFWMPDMNFALDIVWIDADMKVVYIKENAMPENYPEKYTPFKLAKYVLEVPSGYTKKMNIQVSDEVNINW